MDFFNSPLVCGAGGGWAKPGCVLEDALRAGVVNELLTPDETLLHLKPTPGAKAIRKVGWGWRVRYRWGDMIHDGILSDRVAPDCFSAKKSFYILPDINSFVV